MHFSLSLLPFLSFSRHDKRGIVRIRNEAFVRDSRRHAGEKSGPWEPEFETTSIFVHHHSFTILNEADRPIEFCWLERSGFLESKQKGRRWRDTFEPSWWLSTVIHNGIIDPFSIDGRFLFIKDRLNSFRLHRGKTCAHLQISFNHFLPLTRSEWFSWQFLTRLKCYCQKVRT